MEEDEKTRRQENKETRKQGDKTNERRQGDETSASVTSCILVFLYSCIPNPKCLTPYLTSFYNFRNLNYWIKLLEIVGNYCLSKPQKEA